MGVWGSLPRLGRLSVGACVAQVFRAKPANPLSHPTIVGLAERHGKTSAQVVLRWHIEHGRSAVPKSFRPERIAENFNIFDFALTARDIAAIDALDIQMRCGPDPEVVDAATFPIKLED
jgi:2,5-diketo-D-gluconate reductase A